MPALRMSRALFMRRRLSLVGAHGRNDPENRTFDEMHIGESASLVRTLTQKDIDLFAVMSGDINPAHVDEAYARSDMFHKIIAHGMWGAARLKGIVSPVAGLADILVVPDLESGNMLAKQS